MDILDKLGPNGKMIALITTLSLSLLSIILSICALVISDSANKSNSANNTSPSANTSKDSPVFQNDGIILDADKYKWKFSKSKNNTGGLCFYAIDQRGRETSKSCIEVQSNNLYLQNFATK
jgi:hypothetical protein